MKKSINYLLLFAALIVLGVGCQDEPSISEVRTLSLTASMPPEESGSISSMPPEESVSTRIAFTQVGKSVIPTWKNGDQLDLLFVQGSTKVKQTVMVSNISDDRKKADFAINLPEGIQEGTSFDLYGLYGGGGLSDSIPSLAKLPSITGNTPSLTSLANGKKFMMVFSKKGLTTASSNASVTFHHLGSLFCLTLKNARGTAIENLGSARLISSTNGWAYNNSATEQRFYNLVSDTFEEPSSAGDFISLFGDETTVDRNHSLNFWGWYPILPGVTWPELKLQLYDKNNALLGESSNVKPARTTSPGKCYHFYALWDGNGLHFTDDSYAGVVDADGNVYSTVVIGKQEWFAENLKTTQYNDGTPIPNVTDNSKWDRLTTGAYVWYGNDEAAYKNAYGALYNWYAVETGKLCPTGWHVPTDAEWKTLEMKLGMSQAEANNMELRGTNEGSKLAGNAALWKDGNLENDSEFGSSGFTALPGGCRYIINVVFSSVGTIGYWWTSTQNGDAAMSRIIYSKYSEVKRNNDDKRHGFSVRCLRDN